MSISDIPLRKKLALSLFSRYKAAEAKIHRLNYIYCGNVLCDAI